MKKTVSVILLLALLCSLISLISCGEKPSEEGRRIGKVQNAVLRESFSERWRLDFEDVYIEESRAEFSEMKVTCVSENKYKATGLMILVDEYGVKYGNNYYCYVTSEDGEDWDVVGGFHYESTSWKRISDN